MPEESLTLAELQLARETLEAKAQHLRQTLRDVRAAQLKGWAEAFAATQNELITIVTQLAGVKARIRVAVEGEIVSEEDDSDA
jgi:hypothetical protein